MWNYSTLQTEYNKLKNNKYFKFEINWTYLHTVMNWESESDLFVQNRPYKEERVYLVNVRVVLQLSLRVDVHKQNLKIFAN